MHDDNLFVVRQDVDEAEHVAISEMAWRERLDLIGKRAVRDRIDTVATATVRRKGWPKANDVRMTINDECIAVDWRDGHKLIVVVFLERYRTHEKITQGDVHLVYRQRTFLKTTQKTNCDTERDGHQYCIQLIGKYIDVI